MAGHITRNQDVLPSRIAALVEEAMKENEVSLIEGESDEELGIRKRVSDTLSCMKAAELFSDRIFIPELISRLETGRAGRIENAGYHSHSFTDIWNELADGTISGDDLKNKVLDMQDFSRAIREFISDAIRALENRRSANLLVSGKMSEGVGGANDPGDITGFMMDFFGSLMHGDLDADFKWMIPGREIKCRRTGQGLFLRLKDWQPAPAVMDPETRKYIDCPVRPAPPELQHLAIPCPSRQMVIADWFRFDGGPDYFRAFEPDPYAKGARGLDCDIGIIQEVSHFASTFGMGHVFVGNSCPRFMWSNAAESTSGEFAAGGISPAANSPDGLRTALHEDAGPAHILRFGYFDEDDFYEAGKPKGVTPPEDMVITDLWWVSMIDRKRLEDLLVASGACADQDQASAMIEDEEDWHVVDMPSDEAHLYFRPDSGPENRRDADGSISVPGISRAPFFEDYFLVADRDLCLSPDRCQDVAVNIAANIPIPAAASVSPGPDTSPETPSHDKQEAAGISPGGPL